MNTKRCAPYAPPQIELPELEDSSPISYLRVIEAIRSARAHVSQALLREAPTEPPDTVEQVPPVEVEPLKSVTPASTAGFQGAVMTLVPTEAPGQGGSSRQRARSPGDLARSIANTVRINPK